MLDFEEISIFKIPKQPYYYKNKISQILMQKYPILFSCIVIHILKLNRCIRNDGRWLKKRQEVSNKDQTRETGSGENDIVQDVMKMLKSEERSES